ncbi:MAG: PD-(D/E)XK nuclease family protein [Bacilli bacterium]
MIKQYEFNETKEYFIILEREYNSIFLEYKKTHPSLNIKLLSKSDFINAYTFSYDYAAIAFLINKHDKTYNESKKILKIIQLLDTSNDEINSEFLQIKEELFANNLIKVDPYFLEAIKNKEIFLFEYQDDVELRHLLDINNIHYKDLEIGKFLPQKRLEDKVHNFSTIFYETLYLCNSIKGLLKKGIEPSNIFVVVSDIKKYRYSLETYGKVFGILFSIKHDLSYANDPLIIKYIANVFANKKLYFGITPELDVPIVKSFILLMKKFFPDDIDLLAHKYIGISLQEIAQANIYSSYKNESGIKISNKVSFEKNSHNFIIGAYENEFPKYFSDDNILTDSELDKIQLNSSITKNKLGKHSLVNEILYTNIEAISYSNTHLSDKLYPSSILKEMNANVIIENDTQPVYYSKYAAYLDYFIRYDYIKRFGGDPDILEDFKNKLDFKELPYYESKYKSNVFTRINRLVKDEIVLSYTKLSEYFTCPFKYYLNNVLKLSTDQDKTMMKIGNICHKVLEENELIIDINNAKDAMKNLLEANNENDLNYTKNLPLLFEPALRNINTHIKESFIINNIKEESFDYLLDSTVKNIVGEDLFVAINGKVDSILISQFHNKKFASIVDYKTGTIEDYKPDRIRFGFSLQLPIYIILTNEYLKTSAIELGGVYFEKILNNPFDLCRNPLLITGENMFKGCVFTADVDYLSSFSPKLKDDKKIKPFYINKTSITNDEIVSPTDGFNINEIIDATLEKVKEVAFNIANNKFEIKPITEDNVSPCKYCEFECVCYKNYENVITLKELMNPENDESIIKCEEECLEEEGDE